MQVEIQIEGTASILFHAWNNESVEAKGAAAKGSKTKKTDNIESYVYRCADQSLGIPSENFRQALITAAKFKQDPRSPRKSAADLYKAGVIAETLIATTKKKTWDYEDRRRVQIQRNGIMRVRPALKAGWKATFLFHITVPEYIGLSDFRDTCETAGKLVGVGDFRPTFGRFRVSSCKELSA